MRNNELRDQDDGDSQFTVKHDNGEAGYDRHQCFRSEANHQKSDGCFDGDVCIGVRNNELRDQDNDEYDLKKWTLLELVTRMLLECYSNVTEPKIPDLELSFVSLAKKNDLRKERNGAVRDTVEWTSTMIVIGFEDNL
ncbi:hypothetical protein BDQ17DRAFT_1331426 [Cyathus striatus]|nr:hypothetical protein BDQ17DRAFT_1331426 [Cyathus striatus]